MATKSEYLVYLINLTDQALVDTLQGQTHDGGAVGAVIMAPDVAATTYNAVKLTTNLSAFLPPCLSSEWFTAGSDFPTNVKTFDRKSGGWFGISWLFGDKTHYYWRGKFVYAPPEVPTIGGEEVDVPESILKTRWADGFELPQNGEGGTGQPECARMASRHVDGFGLALRSSVNVRIHTTTENDPLLNPTTSWERFYLRLITPPDAATTFWRARDGAVENATGIVLQMTPSGSIAVNQANNVGALTLVATTSALPLNTWIRIDMQITFGVGARLSLGFHGTSIPGMEVDTFTASGFATLGRWHGSSELGTTAANTLAIDFDDWINKNASTTFDSQDFLNGTKCQLVRPTGFAVANQFAGDYRTLLQNPHQGSEDALTNSIAGDVLGVTTDAEQSIDALLSSVGLASMTIALCSSTNGLSGRLGYSWNGGAPITGPLLVQTPAASWQHFIVRIGAVVSSSKTPIELYFIHGNDAVACSVKALFAVAEVMGMFGPEDVNLGSTEVAPVSTGIHNAPYPRTPWARHTSPPAIQPVFKRAGTYVGNGVGQDLAFPVPPAWLWIRPLAGGTGGAIWFTSLLASHRIPNEVPVANLVPDAVIDPNFVVAGGVDGNDLPAAPATVAEAMQLASSLAYDPPDKHTDPAAWANYLDDPDYYFRRMLGEMLAEDDPNVADHGLYAFPPSPWINRQQQQALVRLSGGNADTNANGVTYAYMAFADPAMRFCINGALSNHKGALDHVTQLWHTTFTAIAGFFLQEIVGGGATPRLYYKGAGHTATAISSLTAAELAAALQFGAGTLRSKAAFHGNWTQIAFSLFRLNDGSADPGIARVVCIFSYVGDGAGTRTLAILPATGRRPMWALVVPHNGAAFMRDPSHLTTTSTLLPNTANPATGITAGGVDSMTVGAPLNALGITYDVLVFPGLEAPGNGGWSPPGDDWPVDPTPPDGPGPWAPDPPVGPDPPTEEPVPPGTPIDPVPPTGPMPGLGDDLDAACEPDTKRIINVALSRLGVSKQIVNVATDVTPEATTMRLVYKDAVEATLRDFPWPFATRYARLAVVTTGPNSDWAFSYRAPNDCLFERRLVVARSATIDAPMIPMALSTDDTGGLIFTNQANAVLEYTARPKCPHTRSEPLFRDAVSWRLAAAAAPGLTRMSSRADECMKQYAATLVLALDVLRPGNPGPAPAAPTVDTSAAAIAANVMVANWALVRIGAQTVRNILTDQSREAIAVRLVFEAELQATLRDFPWPFATVYYTPTLVGGTPAVRLNHDWHYSYRLPDDVMLVRRIVTEAGRGYERFPERFRLGQDATGKLLYTDRVSTVAEPLVIEYTTRPEACVAVADSLFRDAFAWRLASSVAPSIAQKDPEAIEQRGRGPEDPRAPKERPATGAQLRARAATYALQRYQQTLITARVSTSNEAQPDIIPPDADWIRGRE